MQDVDIEKKIASFSHWHYRFNLKGHVTPITKQQWVIRHRYRKRHFFDPLVQLFGGSLEGKRVLDLGCNAGFWSLQAIRAGCDFVLGVDGRRMHVDQANFVFEVKGVDRDRYEFVEGNVFETDLEKHGPFDVVLCLGLLYHVSKPMELMERMTAVNSDVILIDTTLSTRQGSCFEVRHNPLDEPRNAVDYELVMVPTRKAVHDLARQFDYSIVTLKPDFQNPKGETDHRGAVDYKRGSRRAFFLSRHTDLSGAPVEAEPGRQANGPPPGTGGSDAP